MNANEEIRQLKEELTELKSWKDSIGLPAVQQNQQLIIQNEQYKGDNMALSLRLETYSSEVDKLKQEMNDLTQELDIAVERSTTNLQEVALRRTSLQQREHELQAADERSEMLESQHTSDKQRIASLTQKTTELSNQIAQYELILTKVQQEDILLKDKMQNESTKLNELQAKYKQLDMEYYNQQSVTNELHTEVRSLNKQMSRIAESPNPLTSPESHGKNEELPTLHSHAHNKTIRIAPHTLRMSNVNSDACAQHSAAHSPVSDNDTTPYDVAIFEELDSERTRLELVNAETFHVNASPEQTHRGTFHTSTPDILKERLQMEFDDCLAKEKGKLIEKHKAEIAGYKKQIMQLKRTQNGASDGGSVTRMIHQRRHNPNNEQDMSKCRVFGWSMW